MADSILICQNRTCRRQGSARVLAAFHRESHPQISIIGSGCLGQCGRGPMVVILPEEIWYGRVQPEEVPLLLTRHCPRP